MFHLFMDTPMVPFTLATNQVCSLQELVTCLMALSVSMDGCALIQELVQRGSVVAIIGVPCLKR